MDPSTQDPLENGTGEPQTGDGPELDGTSLNGLAESNDSGLRGVRADPNPGDLEMTDAPVKGEDDQAASTFEISDREVVDLSEISDSNSDMEVLRDTVVIDGRPHNESLTPDSLNKATQKQNLQANSSIADNNRGSSNNSPIDVDTLDSNTETSPRKRIKTEGNQKPSPLEMGATLIDLEVEGDKAPIGKSFLIRSNASHEESHPKNVRVAQRKLLAERMRQSPIEAQIAPNILGESHTAPSIHGPRSDGENFQVIKRRYIAKKDEGKNTIEDDVLFQRAKNAVLDQIRALQQQFDEEYGKEVNEGAPEEANAAEDSSSLFIQDPLNGFSRLVRSVPRKSGRLRKAEQDELNRQLNLNMWAGVTDRIRDALVDRELVDSTFEEDPMKDGQQEDINQTPSQTMKRKRGYKKKTGFRNLAPTGLSRNGKPDERRAIPEMVGRAKNKAMTALLASIPLEKGQKGQARADKANILECTRILGNCVVKKNANPGEGQWQLNGLTCGLLHHQVIGAAKMKNRELTQAAQANGAPSGILADDTGLGKTIETLALILANAPKPSETRRATLIVTTPALLGQWDNEVEDKTHPFVLPTFIRHYGTHKLCSTGQSGRTSVSLLEQADAVLTTYGEVMLSYPRFDQTKAIQDAKERVDSWHDIWENGRGLLHRVHWYRVVIDEAQAIKNHHSVTSVACSALMGRYRWALSATPIQNSLKELYPYFKFLQLPSTGTFNVFKSNFIGDYSKLHMERLNRLLDSMMIRRLQDDELMGCKIVDLPPFKLEILPLSFTRAERVIYDHIYLRFIQAINAAAKYGDETKRRMILTKITRLRQVASHILALQEFFEDSYDPGDINGMWAKVRLSDSPEEDDSERTMSTLKAMVEAKESEIKLSSETWKGEFEKPATKVENGNLIELFRPILSNLEKRDQIEDLRNRLQCQKCRKPPEEPHLTSCFHVYCKPCLMELAADAGLNDQDRTTCFKCDHIYMECQPIMSMWKDLTAKFCKRLDSRDNKPREKATGKPRKTWRDNLKWAEYNGKTLSSTKSNAIINQVKEWHQKDPTAKVVVFAQFHTFMRIVEKECKQLGWKCCVFNGEMTPSQREEVLKKFKSDPEMTVMISSLLCGGVGLNLTAAQYAILVDPWFNSAKEHQASGRIHRIGQTKETFVKRFIIQDSIDERLLRMQERKEKEINKVIGNKEFLSSLTMDELMTLFGEVRHNENNVPFIVVEEQPLYHKIAKRYGRGGADAGGSLNTLDIGSTDD